MTILLAGTAVTRKDAVGTLYRWSDSGGWEPAQGIPLNTGVQAFAAHPMMPGVVFAAARSGVYKSTDSGASWRRVGVPSHDEEFWSVSVHPTRPGVIYTGAAPVGVYRSEDCGESWQRVGISQGMRELCDMTGATGFSISRLMRLYCDPTNPASMYGACETNGLIVSEDGGQSWRDASQALIEIADKNEKLRSKITSKDDWEGMLDGHAVVVSSLKPGVLFYACRMGVFSTSDKGKTWHNHDIGRFAPITYSRDLRIAVDDPATFYLALSIASRSDFGSLYRSGDLGETWQRVDEAVTVKSTIMSMNVHATDPNKVTYITRGGQVIWTEDRCGTWNEQQLPAQAGDGFCVCII